ncbi:MAG: histidinol-phosphatase, partial [Chitinophagaceae bacterium]
MQPILFIDRDGIILQEPPSDFQIDSINKTRFVPGAITNLSKIAQQLNYYHVMVTNQDGLGTNSFPEADFFPSQNLMLDTLAGEGFQFNEVHVDRSFAAENLPTRKPGTAMVAHLLNNPQFNINESFVIGDRWSDILLAKNLGCKAIYLRSLHSLSAEQEAELRSTIALETDNWEAIFEFLKLKQRVVVHERNTNETKIAITLNVDGSGNANIQTGLGFFDHMLDQIARHGKMDLTIV